MTTRHVLVLGLVALAGACAPGEARETATAALPAVATIAAADTSYRLRPGYVVDSILPIEEALRRFRERVPRVAQLHGGAPSREALVERFLGALARRDTAALRSLVLSRAEFAWLVYPESPYTRPPYRQAPPIVWMQLASASEQGLVRLLSRAGDGHLRAAGPLRCAVPPEREGHNRIWRDCRVPLVRATGDTVAARLFGPLVERDGRFKLASLSSDY